jgi:hypothetical protein
MRQIELDIKSWNWDHLPLAFRLAWMKSLTGKVAYYRMCRLDEVEKSLFRESVIGTPTLLFSNKEQFLMEKFDRSQDLDECYRFSLKWLHSLGQWSTLTVFQRGWRVISGNKNQIAGHDVVLGLQLHSVQLEE